MFATYLYTADVVENAPIGTLVATVQASDKDEGSNSKISYSFDLSDEEEVPFTIDGNRGIDSFIFDFAPAILYLCY